MRHPKTGAMIQVAALGMMLAVLVARDTGAQRRRAEFVATIDGDTMYQVLPPGRIPAITDPVIISGEEAAGQMAGDEPVMGLVINGEVRAYSLWHLDAHEIVNDTVGGTPVAVTW